MRILAIDTALGACSACVLEAGEAEPLASEQLAMDRGHAEALMPLVERVMAGVEGGFASLEDFLVRAWDTNFARRDANDLLAQMVLWVQWTGSSRPVSTS